MSTDAYPGWQCEETAVGLRLERENCVLWRGSFEDIRDHLDSGFDVVVTSPPYNQLGSRIPSVPTGMWGRTDGGKGWVESVTKNGYDDDVPEDEYQQQQNALFSAVAEKCTEKASLFYNHQCRWRQGVLLHPVQWFNPTGWQLRQDIIWDRGGGMMLNARMFCRFDERVLWFTRGKWKWNQSLVGFGTIWSIPVEKNKKHPVAYPEELPRRCILATTDEGDCVLDPYMGSGTTGAFCVKSRRRFVGIERSEKHFDTAVRRITSALQAEKSSLFPAKTLATQPELF